MKAVIMNGQKANDTAGERVRQALLTELDETGWETEEFVIWGMNIGNCTGCFNCWVRTPGVCQMNDANRNIAEAVVSSDLVVFLTTVTSGGYSSTLKKAVDPLIQNISPSFTTVNGETHHKRRYPRYPNLLVMGWREYPNHREEAIAGGREAKLTCPVVGTTN